MTTESEKTAASAPAQPEPKATLRETALLLAFTISSTLHAAIRYYLAAAAGGLLLLVLLASTDRTISTIMLYTLLISAAVLPAAGATITAVKGATIGFSKAALIAAVYACATAMLSYDKAEFGYPGATTPSKQELQQQQIERHYRRLAARL